MQAVSCPPFTLNSSTCFDFYGRRLGENMTTSFSFPCKFGQTKKPAEQRIEPLLGCFTCKKTRPKKRPLRTGNTLFHQQTNKGISTLSFLRLFKTSYPVLTITQPPCTCCSIYSLLYCTSFTCYISGTQTRNRNTDHIP